MTIRSTILAAAAVGVLIGPVSASAEPAYGRQGEHHDVWRREDRGREGREDAHWGWRRAPVYFHRPVCWYENRGFRNGWGRWVVRPVRVCR